MKRLDVLQVLLGSTASSRIQESSLRGRLWLVIGLIVLMFLTMLQPVSALPEIVVHYRCLPHLEPQWHRGTGMGREMLSDKDILDYLKEPVKDSQQQPCPGGLKRQDLLENTPQELFSLENREFARLVLGQRQVFVDIADFMRIHPGVRVMIKFLHPATWYSELTAELDPLSGPPSGPAVCQIGDTWEADFLNRGLVVGKADRYFWDLHLIVFNRDQLRKLGPDADNPTHFDTWDHFYQTALALKSQGFMPLALSTTPDADLLWDPLAPWLWSAGADIVTTKGSPIWWRGDWWQSGLDTPAAMQVIDRFIALKEQDCLESRELSASDLADGVIQGDYTFTLIEPFVAWRARANKQWGDRWPEHLGTAMPPSLDGGTPTLFLGGSLLAVLCRQPQQYSEAIQAAQQWKEYLLSELVVSKHMATQQFIPRYDEVWSKYDNGRFKAFFDAALKGTGYDSSPSSL